MQTQETAQAQKAEVAPAQQPETATQSEVKAKTIEPAPVEQTPDEALRSEAREFMDKLKAEEQQASEQAEAPEKGPAAEEPAKKKVDSSDEDTDADGDEDHDDFEEEVEAKPTKGKGRLYRAKKKIGALSQEIERKNTETFEWQKIANEQHLRIQQLEQQLASRSKAYEDEGFEYDPRLAEIERRDQEIARLKHEKAVAVQQAKLREEAARKRASEQMEEQARNQLSKAFKQHGIDSEEDRQAFMRELTKEVRALEKYVDPIEFAERYTKQLKALRFYEEQQQRQAQVNASSRAPESLGGRSAGLDSSMGSDGYSTDDARAFLRSKGLI